MPVKTVVSVPAPILAEGRYAAALTFAGSSRPSGSGLTGTDLQLWWTLLDLVGESETLDLLQSDIAAVLGQVHSDRLEAALTRLRGTDVIMSGFVAPLVVDHSQLPKPMERRTQGWFDPRPVVVKLDRRVVDLVLSSRAERRTIDVAVPPMRELSSRWSVALYGRFLAWERKHYPASGDIKFRAHPRGRAFELDVPVARLSDVFAFDGEMRRFEILNRFITASSRCPLQRELGRAGVAVDTTVLGSEIAPGGVHGVRIRISEITTRVADLAAADKHRQIRRRHRQMPVA